MILQITHKHAPKTGLTRAEEESTKSPIFTRAHHPFIFPNTKSLALHCHGWAHSFPSSSSYYYSSSNIAWFRRYIPDGGSDYQETASGGGCSLGCTGSRGAQWDEQTRGLCCALLHGLRWFIITFHVSFNLCLVHENWFFIVWQIMLCVMWCCCFQFSIRNQTHNLIFLLNFLYIPIIFSMKKILHYFQFSVGNVVGTWFWLKSSNLFLIL